MIQCSCDIAVHLDNEEMAEHWRQFGTLSIIKHGHLIVVVAVSESVAIYYVQLVSETWSYCCSEVVSLPDWL